MPCIGLPSLVPSISAEDVTMAMGPTHLDLDVGHIEPAEHEIMGTDAIELHGLGADLAVPRNADIIVREQFVEFGGVAGEGGSAPLLLEATG